MTSSGNSDSVQLDDRAAHRDRTPSVSMAVLVAVGRLVSDAKRAVERCRGLLVDEGSGAQASGEDTSQDGAGAR